MGALAAPVLSSPKPLTVHRKLARWLRFRFKGIRKMQVKLKNGRSITVRRKKRDDGEALGAMLERCSQQTYYFFHPYPLTRESGLKAAADESIICFVAFAEDSAVGYAWMSSESDEPSLGVCVCDDWQGLGIGRILLGRLIEEAKRQRKKRMQLTVMKDNARAIALYHSIGFVIDGDAPDSMGPSHHMTLNLEQDYTNLNNHVV
jgi:ribosomal protein S18 acetylase RimI-like enzyme